MRDITNFSSKVEKWTFEGSDWNIHAVVEHQVLISKIDHL